MAEPTCWKCGAVIQGAPFDGDPPTMRFCWECGAVVRTALLHPPDDAEPTAQSGDFPSKAAGE